MPDDQIELLRAAFGKLPALTLSRTRLRNAVADGVSGLTSGEVEDIADLLGSLSAAIASTELSLSELIPSVLEAVGEESDLDESELKLLSERLETLLEIDQLGLVAKASSLLADYEHSFCQAKFLTDIRPVFGSVKEPPSAAVIVHTLRIKYHKGGDIEDFYVSMDGDDLQLLKKLIERAESKMETLAATLRNADVRLIDAAPQDEDG